MTPLFILTGPSGAGKSSVLERLLMRRSLKLVRFVTSTTRPRRTGERNGREYWFVDEKRFLREKRRGLFYESARVYGRWYGSHKDVMKRLKKRGKPIIMILNVAGARTLKRLEPDATAIFLDAPKRDLVTRLKKRGKDVNDLGKRLAMISNEERWKRKADVVIENKNGALGKTVDAVARLVKRLTP